MAASIDFRLFVLGIFISSAKARTDILGILSGRFFARLIPTINGQNILRNHVVVDLTLQIEVVLLEGWAREKSSVCERSAIVWRDKIIKMSEPPLAGSPLGWTSGYLWPSGPPLKHWL